MLQPPPLPLSLLMPLLLLLLPLSASLVENGNKTENQNTGNCPLVCASERQMLVVEVISELCRDPLALVEMFVNYDCDLQAIDLFKRIVTALAKVKEKKGGK